MPETTGGGSDAGSGTQRGCRALEFLAEGLAVQRLVLSGCSRLVQLPKSVVASVLHLDLSHCNSFISLPDNFAHLLTLDSVADNGAMKLRRFQFRLRTLMIMTTPAATEPRIASAGRAASASTV
jgi:hypothetical protein